MSKKFKGIYRIDKPGAKHWDYGSNGAYFFTLNTKNRIKLFGAIDNGVMTLSEIGQIAHNCWEEIPKSGCCRERL